MWLEDAPKNRLSCKSSQPAGIITTHHLGIAGHQQEPFTWRTGDFYSGQSERLRSCQGAGAGIDELGKLVESECKKNWLKLLVNGSGVWLRSGNCASETDQSTRPTGSENRLQVVIVQIVNYFRAFLKIQIQKHCISSLQRSGECTFTRSLIASNLTRHM